MVTFLRMETIMMTILGKVCILWIVTILGIVTIPGIVTILKNDG